MKPALNSSQMKAVENTAVNIIGIPSPVLMERAALAVADAVAGRLVPGDSVLVVCGTGNNGADGLAVARMLHLRGFVVKILIVGNAERATKEWKLQRGICEALSISECSDLCESDAVIDALFGIGLSRPLDYPFDDIIQRMNEMSALKVSIDMPSGISADTGAVMQAAFKADLTITFQFKKTGQLLYPGRLYSKELICADIGIPKIGLSSDCAVYPEKTDLAAFLDRPQDSNKGSFGRILIIAGSVNMCGAAYLSALAAYRSGAGLVEIFTPWENRISLHTLIPEAVLSCYDTENFDRELLIDSLKRADAVVLGPGLSTASYAVEIVEAVLENCVVPLVIDADAINILASNSDKLLLCGCEKILTPHIKEMSKICGLAAAKIKADPISVARDFAKKINAVMVLKDAATVTASPAGNICINTSGNSAMATGGSGDVLTGIIAARCALYPEKCYDNARLCVYLHGLAGEAAAQKMGKPSVMARDIAESIGDVLCRI